MTNRELKEKFRPFIYNGWICNEELEVEMDKLDSIKISEIAIDFAIEQLSEFLQKYPNFNYSDIENQINELQKQKEEL